LFPPGVGIVHDHNYRRGGWFLWKQELRDTPPVRLLLTVPVGLFAIAKAHTVQTIPPPVRFGSRLDQLNGI
jgi:hypothetical protein